MFKIESYITPILLSYVDKYVRDFKPADAQVSVNIFFVIYSAICTLWLHLKDNF